MEGLRLPPYFEPPKDNQQDEKDDEKAYPAPEIQFGEFIQTNCKKDDGYNPNKPANTPSHFVGTSPITQNRPL